MQNLSSCSTQCQQWFSLPQTAQHLHVPQRQVVNLIHRHELRAKLVAGMRWFVNDSAISAYRHSGAV